MNTIGPEVVERARELAQKYMKGSREGGCRPSWKHPEDVALLVQEVPGIRDTDTQHYLEALAWLHDLLEDTPLTDKDLLQEGIPEHVVVGVKALTKEEWMTTSWYYRELDRSFELVKIVKCCDRIANLREGASSFSPKRWAKYVRETRDYVWPLTFDMDQPWAAWLAKKLEEASGGDF